MKMLLAYNFCNLVGKSVAERIDIHNQKELPIDPELSELIPYFIKGELYEEDNPQQASIARNYFEDTVDDYLSTKNQTAVEVVWRLDV